MEWRSLYDACPQANQSYSFHTKLLSAKVCFDMFLDQTTQVLDSAPRTKRSAAADNSTPTPTPSPTPPALFPRMLAIAIVDQTTHNSPPVIDNITLIVNEDDEHGTSTNITYTDGDDDVLEFSLLARPQHGTASVTSAGVVTYFPEENFAGDDVIGVRAVEVLDAASLEAGVSPHVVDFNVSVTVVNSNDPPDLLFIPDPSNNSGIIEMSSSSEAGIQVSVLVEGNTTTTVPLGNLVLGDLDLWDSIVLLNRSEENVNATFLTTYALLEDSRPENLSMEANATMDSGKGLVKPNPDPKSVNTGSGSAETESYDIVNGTVYKNQPTPYKVEEAKALSLTLAEGYQGFVQYEARVKDASDAYSAPLTLGVHVLMNPCVQGQCEAIHAGDTCSNPQRAFSFSNYRCHCHVGYEGDWCEREIDECATNPCVFLAHCRDLVGEYRCDYTIAAIVLAFVAAVVVVVVVVVCRSRTRRHNKVENDPSETSSTLELFKGGKPQVFLQPESFPAPSTSPQDFMQRMQDNAVSHVSYQLSDLRHSNGPCVYCDSRKDVNAFVNHAYDSAESLDLGDLPGSAISSASATADLPHSERCVYCQH